MYPLKTLLKRSDVLVETVQLMRDNRSFLIRQSRQVRQKWARRVVINNYLHDNSIRKLQIGSGHNIREGWLNTDYSPRLPQHVFLDATKPFPFLNSSFQYIFSEHMLEHVDYSQGLFMARECHRVLKPNGIIRIATPNLRNFLDLYHTEKSDAQKRYILWALEYNQLPRTAASECFILNNFLRSFGHKFVYDPETLQSLLDQAGFKNIRRFAPGQSDDENLRNIEVGGARIGEANNFFETMVFEATRVI
jgi:predicted SAM-dependent methyltransferase